MTACRPGDEARAGGKRRHVPPAPAGGPSPAQCPGGLCITCSDTAVEVTVLRLLPDGLAVAGTGAGQEEISVALVTAAPGDRVLVHASEAIAVIGR